MNRLGPYNFGDLTTMRGEIGNSEKVKFIPFTARCSSTSAELPALFFLPMGSFCSCVMGCLSDWKQGQGCMELGAFGDADPSSMIPWLEGFQNPVWLDVPEVLWEGRGSSGSDLGLVIFTSAARASLGSCPRALVL